MSAYVIGNFIGRFLISALIVYVVLLLMNRMQFKQALGRMIKPMPAIFVVLLFLLGLAGSAYAASDRAQRPFEATEIPRAGLVVYVPSRPKWDMDYVPRGKNYAVLLSTPQKYYPPASMEIVLNSGLRVSNEELPEVAVSTLNVVREKAGISTRIDKEQLQAVKYGEIEAYQDVYEMQSEGVTYSIKSVMGIMPTGRPITMFLATQQGQLEHVEHMVKKIWENLSEFPVDTK